MSLSSKSEVFKCEAIMKILSFSPYSLGRANDNLITLLGAYLNRQEAKVDNLRCNGCFSICENDAQSSWRGSFSKCFNCQAKQFMAGSWYASSKLDLGSLLTPEEVQQSNRLISECHAEDLIALCLNKVSIFDNCAGTFEVRFATRELDASNYEQVNFARKLMLTALRNMLAVQKLVLKEKYELAMVPDGRDVLTCSFVSAARSAGTSVAVFKYDRLEGNVFVVNPLNHEIKVVENVPLLDELASDCSDWSEDLISEIRDILAFLALKNEQLSLMALAK